MQRIRNLPNRKDFRPGNLIVPAKVDGQRSARGRCSCGNARESSITEDSDGPASRYTGSPPTLLYGLLRAFYTRLSDIDVGCGLFQGDPGRTPEQTQKRGKTGRLLMKLPPSVLGASGLSRAFFATIRAMLRCLPVQLFQLVQAPDPAALVSCHCIRGAEPFMGEDKLRSMLKIAKRNCYQSLLAWIATSAPRE